jgi:hypothetical protein
MKRLLLLTLLLLVTAASSFAQTTVNLTVTDSPDNQLWNNGTWQVKLQQAAGNSSGTNSFTLLSGGGSLLAQTGSLSGTATAAIVLPANANIGPGGTTWQFTVCPQPANNAACFQQSVTVSTSSPQTLNINPPSIRINLAVATPPVSAYATGEITGAVVGSQFFLIGTGIQVCSVVTGNSCTTWVSAGGGSGTAGSAGLVDPTQAPYNVKMDARTGGDGTSTNGSPTFSSTNSVCVASDATKSMVVVNVTNGTYPYGTGNVTVLSCNGNSWTLSGNANGNAGATQNWAVGSAGNGAGFQAAYNAAQAAGKTIALPCGAGLLDSVPFANPATIDFFRQRIDLVGCQASIGTVFIAHPQWTNALLATGGTLFSNLPGNVITGGLFQLGAPGSFKIQDIEINGLGGQMPANNKSFTLINGYGHVSNLKVFGMGLDSGSITYIQGNAESRYENLNFQDPAAASVITTLGVQFSGQGQNSVKNSIFANGITVGAQCSGGGNIICDFEGNYCTQVSNCFSIAGGGGYQISFIANECATTGAGANHSCINDGSSGTTTNIYAFANTASTTAATTPVFDLGPNTVFDVSGTSATALTSGYSIRGTGRVNDRAGNTFTGPLTQFTGTYVPIGGGSVATNSASAATNIDTNITATNIVAVSPGAATYDVKVGFRQVTAGTTCGAGSNTVNGIIRWTAGGAAQATGSNGVPALGTLTVSANGTVGTSSAYSSIPIHADINTAITYETTAVLASAGCTIKPQYVVDFSNI